MKYIELMDNDVKNQTELSKLFGVSQRTISAYLNGESQPNITTLCKIADYYGVSLDYLCDHETNQLDISYYSPTAKEIVKKLPLLNNSNLMKLDSVCDGLILGQ